jgi:hypothetical protein
MSQIIKKFIGYQLNYDQIVIRVSDRIGIKRYKNTLPTYWQIKEILLYITRHRLEPGWIWLHAYPLQDHFTRIVIE